MSASSRPPLLSILKRGTVDPSTTSDSSSAQQSRPSRTIRIDPALQVAPAATTTADNVCPLTVDDDQRRNLRAIRKKEKKKEEKEAARRREKEQKDSESTNSHSAAADESHDTDGQISSDDSSSATVSTGHPMTTRQRVQADPPTTLSALQMDALADLITERQDKGLGSNKDCSEDYVCHSQRVRRLQRCTTSQAVKDTVSVDDSLSSAFARCNARIDRITPTQTSESEIDGASDSEVGIAKAPIISAISRAHPFGKVLRVQNTNASASIQVSRVTLTSTVSSHVIEHEVMLDPGKSLWLTTSDSTIHPISSSDEVHQLPGDLELLHSPDEEQVTVTMDWSVVDVHDDMTNEYRVTIPSIGIPPDVCAFRLKPVRAVLRTMEFQSTYATDADRHILNLRQQVDSTKATHKVPIQSNGIQQRVQTDHAASEVIGIVQASQLMVFQNSFKLYALQAALENEGLGREGVNEILIGWIRCIKALPSDEPARRLLIHINMAQNFYKRGGYLEHLPDHVSASDLSKFSRGRAELVSEIDDDTPDKDAFTIFDKYIFQVKVRQEELQSLMVKDGVLKMLCDDPVIFEALIQYVNARVSCKLPPESRTKRSVGNAVSLCSSKTKSSFVYQGLGASIVDRLKTHHLIAVQIKGPAKIAQNRYRRSCIGRLASLITATPLDDCVEVMQRLDDKILPELAKKHGDWNTSMPRVTRWTHSKVVSNSDDNGNNENEVQYQFDSKYVPSPIDSEDAGHALSIEEGGRFYIILTKSYSILNPTAAYHEWVPPKSTTSSIDEVEEVEEVKEEEEVVRMDIDDASIVEVADDDPSPSPQFGPDDDDRDSDSEEWMDAQQEVAVEQTQHEALDLNGSIEPSSADAEEFSSLGGQDEGEEEQPQKEDAIEDGVPSASVPSIAAASSSASPADDEAKDEEQEEEEKKTSVTQLAQPGTYITIQYRFSHWYVFHRANIANVSMLSCVQADDEASGKHLMYL